MNANRMKYASTPTYGMQKRGFLKKPANQLKAPESPDFSQAPEPLFNMPPQQLFSVPQGAGFQQSPFPTPPTYFSPNLNIPPMQQTSQMPYGAPPFMNYQQQPAPSMLLPNSIPPMFATQQNNMSFPMGNSAPAMNAPAEGFSPRAQGYVPPMPQQPMQQGSQTPRPCVQPATFTGGTNNMLPPYYPNMQQGMQQQAMLQQGMPVNQQAMGFQPSQPMMPLFQTTQPNPQGNGMQQPPMYNTRTAAQPQEHLPIDANKLWTVFLFGLLPLLFIPCLFVPSSFDFLRYIFLALTVCGLGGMWYRQMFTPTIRLVVSIVYVVLCIVTIAMMMQGVRDAKQLGGRNDQPAYAQSTQNPGPDLNASVAATQPPLESTPNPANLGPSAAEQRLTEFMTLWQGNNTPEMVSYVQPSWASAQDVPSSQLFIVLANRTPEAFTIEDISGTDDDSSRTVTMSATINKNNGKEASIYRFMVLMVKESGEWYVDPNSLATNDELPKENENVVNNVNSGGLMTAAPRTTVTPVPAASTTLYFNENGGTYYHIDDQCPSVKPEFLPLTGSFPYSELTAHNALKPCLKCGAPTKALSDAPVETITPDS